MQRNNNQDKKIEKEIIDNLVKTGDKFGYYCIAPTLSFFSGENKIKNGAMALTFCPLYFPLKNPVEKIAERNPELNSGKSNIALSNLFSVAGSRGSCRFWQKYGEAGGQEPECLTVDTEFEKAEKECYEILSKMELK